MVPGFAAPGRATEVQPARPIATGHVDRCLVRVGMLSRNREPRIAKTRSTGPSTRRSGCNAIARRRGTTLLLVKCGWFEKVNIRRQSEQNHTNNP